MLLNLLLACNMNREEFYAAVAALLNVENTYKTPAPYRKRWGQRNSGNGQYKGIGVVRWYNTNLIHCMLPNGSKVFDNPEAALEFIALTSAKLHANVMNR